MTQKPFVYLTNCVDSVADLITPMQEAATEICYATFVRYCDPLEPAVFRDIYVTDKRRGLTLKDDYMVSFYKSVFSGVPCYYVYQSAIAYIWVPREEEAKLRKAMKEQKRRENLKVLLARRHGTRDLDRPDGSELPSAGGDAATSQPSGSYHGWAEPL